MNKAYELGRFICESQASVAPKTAEESLSRIQQVEPEWTIDNQILITDELLSLINDFHDLDDIIRILGGDPEDESYSI